MTPSGLIPEIRSLVNDTDAVAYRYDDVFLVQMVNRALKQIALLRPDLFSVFTNLACTANAVLQAAPVDSIRIMEVMRVVGGNALYESNRETMDQHSPTWPVDAASDAITWMRHPRDPNKFYVYPQSPIGQVLHIEYAQFPPTYASGATIGLSDAYAHVVVDCVVFLIQSIDNEHVASGRAKMFYDSFTQALGIQAQQRVTTDAEAAGLPKGVEV